MVKKAMAEELKELPPDPVKGAMSVDILHWAMDQAEFDDACQRDRWAKYKSSQDKSATEVAPEDDHDVQLCRSLQWSCFNWRGRVVTPLP